MPDLTAKIERVARPDGPMIRVPYIKGSSYEHWDFPAGENTFDVPADVAQEAIATGFFRSIKSEPVKGETAPAKEAEPSPIAEH